MPWWACCRRPVPPDTHSRRRLRDWHWQSGGQTVQSCPNPTLCTGGCRGWNDHNLKGDKKRYKFLSGVRRSVISYSTHIILVWRIGILQQWPLSGFFFSFKERVLQLFSQKSNSMFPFLFILNPWKRVLSLVWKFSCVCIWRRTSHSAKSFCHLRRKEVTYRMSHYATYILEFVMWFLST